MSAQAAEVVTEGPLDPDFGIAPQSARKLRNLFQQIPRLERVWIYGSRARGGHRPESDIDLVFDAPEMSADDVTRFKARVEDLGLLYGVDLTHWQDKLDDSFRRNIERDRQVFWEPRRARAEVEHLGGIVMKPFQSEVLTQLGRYLDELKRQRDKAAKAANALRVAEIDVPNEMSDYPRKAWDALREAQQLPPAFASLDYNSRFDGAGQPIPNACLKVPTGGGKTLLAAASVARTFSGFLGKHTGLVLWVVPNEAIYEQTRKALTDRDHPYRQMLNVAGAGRVKILEKHSPLSRMDVDSHLCVMLLMLQSAARRSKETLRFFRDRGNVLGFLPREDDIEGHFELLDAVPNLDAYAPTGLSSEEISHQKGSIAKSSLGNVMRMLRPMVVIDEGHHAYTENALSTLDGFNPSFLLELSATPRVADTKKKRGGSNILVDVRGTDLDAAEMIKLPINVDVRPWNDWESCLSASVDRLNQLHAEADRLHGETARYIRPILLVQVERTGSDMLESGFIHAEDAKTYLLQLGFHESQIAIKTSEKNDLRDPENIDLLSPTCEVRVIITKQALQEGWDCPFAYVLCALAAGRNPAAMTQLVGRILRQPQVAKTGREALDACYVLCHDAKTAKVVGDIKKSLEQEGMGDLALHISDGGSGSGASNVVTAQRRERFRKLRLFLPRVTWVEDDTRRELDYFSDVLAQIDWHAVNTEALCANWAPDPRNVRAQQVRIGLSILEEPESAQTSFAEAGEVRLDRARVVRALLDLAPNPWIVWGWVDAVLTRLLTSGLDEGAIAASSASLIETLRLDLEAERDRLAQGVFESEVAAGRIEFRLRADATDYELPHNMRIATNGDPQPLMREDYQPVQKSLLEPMFKAMLDNPFECNFATYLDQQAALDWWHRNVAKSQYGLQGWRRNKVYPDFVFALSEESDQKRVVVMETKGAHLKNEDTDYKQRLLQMLSDHFRDERHHRAGELELAGRESTLVCDLVFDDRWRATTDARYFSG